MITHIRMKNFKSWKDSRDVKLAPLTGFFGPNSSGKSSLLQMLLLLKQTAERSDPEEVIFFGDENSLVNLGSFREVIHGHKDDALLALEFGCRLQNPLTIEIPQRIDRFGVSRERFPLDIDSFTFDTAIRGTVGSSSIEHFSYISGRRNRALSVDELKSIEHVIHIGGHAPIPKIRWESGEVYYGDIHLDHLNVENCYGGPAMDSGSVLKPLPAAFEELFAHVYYLGPTRVEPQRRYAWTGGHPEHPGWWGNQTVDALLSARVRKLKTLRMEGRLPYTVPITVPIEDRVSYWLQEMDLAHSFSLDWISQGSSEYEVRIQKSPGSAAVTLVDMGYGLGQFLPVLVLCYYAPEGSTLILEQPGNHLHPKVQSQLADLLIEVVTERNLQILIESHSEHLLTRLQLGIAEKKISAERTALYFCENENGVSTIKSLDVDELGNIKNWPKNFFGNVRGDLVKMTREQMKRQKKAEG